MPNKANLSESISVTPPNNNTHTTPSDNAPYTAAASLSFAERKDRAGLRNMSDPLFEKHERIHSLENEQDIHGAATRYEIGTHVADVIDNRSVYGRNDVAKLARLNRADQSTYRDYARVAKAWSPEQFEELMILMDKQRRSLSFSHLIRISSVADKTERQKWIDLVLENGWSERNLGHKMKEQANEVDPGTDEPEDGDVEGGEEEVIADTDEIATPARVRLAIVRMRGEVELISSKEGEWNARVFEPLGKDPGQFGKAVIDELLLTSESNKKAIKSMQEIDERIDGLLKKARQAKKRSVTTVTEGGDHNGN